ncbi:DnaD domain protein [Lactococcus kimchii]|uniref:DnaD domain protein n=1 Tax=Lactococcus sp. S-13 TaxID=2507158 RepID=UPI001023DE6F|nr:helicase DnaB [Lactococcus sp. S-13]
MRAGDSFTMINRGKTSFDAEAFTLLYLPIIGTDAFALYQLMLSFSTGRISHFLEYLNIGLHPFSEALDKLSALALVRVFDDHSTLYLEVKSPLNFENFLADDFYRQLLISRIGENRVAGLAKTLEPKGKEISKKFHEIYKVNFTAESQSAKQTNQLDMGAFQSLMERQALHFSDENKDRLTLYSLAEKFELNWYELFKQAESTANADKTLNMSNLIRKLSAQSEPQPALSEFPKAFADLILISKSHEPEEFLRQIKTQAGGFVSSDERKILANLARQNLPAQVQNVLIHYILIQQKNASLSANFVNTLANDWLRNKVFTAETAVKRILERNEQAANKATQAAARTTHTGPAKIKKAAPEWSNPNYENKTSQADLVKLEQIRLDSLKKLENTKPTS